MTCECGQGPAFHLRVGPRKEHSYYGSSHQPETSIILVSSENREMGHKGLKLKLVTMAGMWSQHRTPGHTMKGAGRSKTMKTSTQVSGKDWLISDQRLHNIP